MVEIGHNIYLSLTKSGSVLVTHAHNHVCISVATMKSISRRKPLIGLLKTAPAETTNVQRCEALSNEDAAFSTEPTRKDQMQMHQVGKAFFVHVSLLRTGKKEAA